MQISFSWSSSLLSFFIQVDNSPPSVPSLPSVSQNGFFRQNTEGGEDDGGRHDDDLMVHPQ
jgi:hypothetical protein